MPHVLSVNIGAETATSHSTIGVTGIDKRPTERAVPVSAPGPKGIGGSGLAGDAVCDRRHHGGNDQAVYAYGREDLDSWQSLLGRDLPNGGFGENLTTSGLDLATAIVGETWQIGSDLVLQVTDPRIPCRTFAGFLDERGWIKRFSADGRTGTYLRVLTPGSVRAGDPIKVLQRPDHGITTLVAFRAFTTQPELLPRLLNVPTLSTEARRNVVRRTAITLDADAG